MKFAKAQIERIMIIEELKTVEGALAILDMRSRAAKKIRRRRNSKRNAVLYKELLRNMNMERLR